MDIESVEKGIREEYCQIRNLIDKSIERQDNYFLTSFAVLGIGNIFQQNNTFYFGFAFMCLALFFVLKIIETRDQIFYNTTYLIVFVENPSYGLQYETRFQKLRRTFWTKEGGFPQKTIYNNITKFGYYVKNGIIFVLVVVLYMQTVADLFPLITLMGYIKFVVITLLLILHLIYLFVLLNDRFKTGEYLKKWKILKETKQNTMDI